MRVGEGLLNSVFYLYTTVEAATQGDDAGGCGFFLWVESSFPNRPHIYAVTNEHVVRDPYNATVIRVNSVSGDTDTIDLAGADWIEHLEADVAIWYLGLMPVTSHHEQTILADHTLVTEDNVYFGEVGLGDNCLMIGRFSQHPGISRNVPMARFGNISALPHDPISTGRGKAQPAFLVEMRSLSGFSGSPVWDTEKRKDGTRSSLMLGIDCGHMAIESPASIRDSVTNKRTDVSIVRDNSGFAVVVPAWRLRELLDEEAIVATRKKEEDRQLAELKKSVVLDAAVEGTRGPRANRLAIASDWRDAVKHTLQERGKPKTKG